MVLMVVSANRSGPCWSIVSTGEAVEIDFALGAAVFGDVLDDLVASVAQRAIVHSTAALGLTILTAGGWLRVESRAVGRDLLSNVDRADGLV